MESTPPARSPPSTPPPVRPATEGPLRVPTTPVAMVEELVGVVRKIRHFLQIFADHEKDSRTLEHLLEQIALCDTASDIGETWILFTLMGLPITEMGMPRISFGADATLRGADGDTYEYRASAPLPEAQPKRASYLELQGDGSSDEGA